MTEFSFNFHYKLEGKKTKNKKQKNNYKKQTHTIFAGWRPDGDLAKLTLVHNMYDLINLFCIELALIIQNINNAVSLDFWKLVKTSIYSQTFVSFFALIYSYC